jgi:hypothetical protein
MVIVPLDAVWFILIKIDGLDVIRMNLKEISYVDGD